MLVRGQYYCCLGSFFFQAEDGIRDLVRSRGLGDVYKRQPPPEQNNGGLAGNAPGGSFDAPPPPSATTSQFTLSLIHI